jgi:hypothetical protein
MAGLQGCLGGANGMTYGRVRPVERLVHQSKDHKMSYIVAWGFSLTDWQTPLVDGTVLAKRCYTTADVLMLWYVWRKRAASS